MERDYRKVSCGAPKTSQDIRIDDNANKCILSYFLLFLMGFSSLHQFHYFLFIYFFFFASFFFFFCLFFFFFVFHFKYFIIIILEPFFLTSSFSNDYNKIPLFFFAFFFIYLFSFFGLFIFIFCFSF